MAGSVAAALVVKRIYSSLGVVILVPGIAIGIILYLIGSVQSVVVACFYFLLVGVVTGLNQVAIYSGVQMRTEELYMGRVMSYLAFSSLGFVPVSIFYFRVYGGVLFSFSAI